MIVQDDKGRARLIDPLLVEPSERTAWFRLAHARMTRLRQSVEDGDRVEGNWKSIAHISRMINEMEDLIQLPAYGVLLSFHDLIKERIKPSDYDEIWAMATKNQ